MLENYAWFFFITIRQTDSRGVFMLRELSQNIREMKKKERNVVCAEMRLLHWPSQTFTL